MVKSKSALAPSTIILAPRWSSPPTTAGGAPTAPPQFVACCRPWPLQPTINPLVSQTYTPDGLVGSIVIARNNTLPADATTYTYDGFDRLSATAYPNGGSGATSESLTYDADSNVRTRTTRNGAVIAFAYDTLNRLCTKTYAASAVACGGSSANYLVKYAYDLDGRLIAANDNSATVTALTATPSFTWTASYDALNRPVGMGWTPAAAQTTPAVSSTATFMHAYDPDNRRAGQGANDNSWLQYPGGASTIAYAANALNQYTAVAAATPTYDGNGNLTFDGTFTYAYDAESRLTSVTQGVTPVATYAYDAQGRRKSKLVAGVTTAYVTDADDREVLEYDGASGAAQTWYAYGPGSNDVLNQINLVASTRATLIPDIQGSVIAALSSGGTLSKNGYLPFGESTSTTTASNGFFYTGGRLDPETIGSASQPSGLYYFRNRHYSQTLGRFLQADPSGYGAGPNLYTYALNSPLNLIDPFGLTADGPGQTSQLPDGSTQVSEVDVFASRSAGSQAQLNDGTVQLVSNGGGGTPSIFAPGRLEYILKNHGWDGPVGKGRFYPEFSNPAALTALALGSLKAADQNPSGVLPGNQPNSFVIPTSQTLVDIAGNVISNVDVGISATGLRTPSVVTNSYITVLGKGGIINMYPVNPNDPAFTGH